MYPCSVSALPSSKKPPQHRVFLKHYDSLHHTLAFTSPVLKKLESYLQLEHFERFDEWIDASDVESEVAVCAEQHNEYDCGVHVCANAFVECFGIKSS